MDRYQSAISGAAAALRENLLRSILTMLALAIGVASVALLVALGRGVEADVRSELDRVGVNLVVIVPGKLEPGGMPNFMSMAAMSTLTEQDAEAIAGVPGVEQCGPVMLVSGSLEDARMSHSALVAAMPPRLLGLLPSKLAEGRLLDETDAVGRGCVLGFQPRRAVFGTGPALGHKVRIRGKEYVVRGTLAEEKSSVFGMMSFSNIAAISVDAARRDFPGAQINRIILTVSGDAKPETVLASVRKVLLRMHDGREDFGVLTQEQLLGLVYRVLRILTALLAGISAISLVVAGVGVMNITLVTVTERTREIGLRKAVGARRSDICLQFLAEALALSILGGAAGVAIAAALCTVIAVRSPLNPVMTLGGVGVALGVCIGVGLLFGIAPAMRAALLDPVEALRRE